MKVAVVILNWNGKGLLEKFLPSVITHSSGVAEVYIVDNASTDDSVSWVKQSYPSLNVVQNHSNGGYAKGYNDGLKHIQADYYILLNSDVEVTAGWIEPVIHLMETHSAIGACQPKLLNYNIRDEFEYAGGAGGFLDKWSYPFCRGRIFDAFEKDRGQYDDTREIFWASGACLFVRARSFWEAGGLDEDFFAHMEEIDLCWRMRNLGHTVYYCGTSTVFHVGAGTLAKMNPRKTFYNFRNNLFLITKNQAPGFLFFRLVFRGILDGIAAFKFLFSGDGSHFLAVIKGHFSYYAFLGKTLEKRRKIRKQVVRYATSCIYRRSIVWDYYLAGKKRFSDLRQDLF